MTALSPGQSPPPVSNPTFIAAQPNGPRRRLRHCPNRARWSRRATVGPSAAQAAAVTSAATANAVRSSTIRTTSRRRAALTPTTAAKAIAAAAATTAPMRPGAGALRAPLPAALARDDEDRGDGAVHAVATR